MFNFKSITEIEILLAAQRTLFLSLEQSEAVYDYSVREGSPLTGLGEKIKLLRHQCAELDDRVSELLEIAD